MGPCKKCKESKFLRLMCFCKASDCEEKNKKALQMARVQLENDTTPNTLRQQIPLPDAVHLGKNLNESFLNCFLRNNGSRINKSMLRTLYHDPEQQSSLKKLIRMKALRYTMDTTEGREISSPKVCEVLKGVETYAQTIIPEKFRMYESNKPGILKHPTQICNRPEGCILVTN